MGTFKPATKVVHCPACGAVNPAGKSKHCDSCGCYLPGLLEVEERLPDPVPVRPVYNGSKLIAFQDAGSDYVGIRVVAPRSSIEDSIFLSALQARQTQAHPTIIAPEDQRAGAGLH